MSEVRLLPLLRFLQKLGVADIRLLCPPTDHLRVGAEQVRVGDGRHPDLLRVQLPGAILKRSTESQNQVSWARLMAVLTWPTYLTWLGSCPSSDDAQKPARVGGCTGYATCTMVSCLLGS